MQIKAEVRINSYLDGVREDFDKAITKSFPLCAGVARLKFPNPLFCNSFWKITPEVAIIDFRIQFKENTSDVFDLLRGEA